VNWSISTAIRVAKKHFDWALGQHFQTEKFQICPQCCPQVARNTRGQATGVEYLIGVCLAMASAFFYAVAAAITKRLKDLPWAPMGITSKVLIGAVATWCAGRGCR
jgi:hypothetical protein